MGRAKQAAIEAEERGYWHLDGNVCINCLHDGDLQALHEKNASTDDCDFCKAEGLPVAPACIIQERIMQSLMASYENIDNAGAPYISREGGWQISNESAEDIILNEAGDAISYELCKEIAEATGEEYWCERDWQLLPPLARLQSGWKQFCSTVRHVLRFSFVWAEGSDDPGHPDHTNPSLTLTGIGDLIDRHNLTTEIKAGTTIYRVRVHDDEHFDDVAELGTPPYQKAGANRMSPAGIPMFYGAEDCDTAVMETWDGIRPVFGSLATFRLKQDIRVIDLETLPPIPGYWSNPGRETLASIRFLHDLANEISLPADRGSLVDLHYAPTQIVSEYLVKARVKKNAFGVPIANHVHGLIFKSSMTGRRNYTLNIFHNDDSEFGDTVDDFLELIDVKHEQFKP